MSLSSIVVLSLPFRIIGGGGGSVGEGWYGKVGVAPTLFLKLGKDFGFLMSDGFDSVLTVWPNRCLVLSVLPPICVVEGELLALPCACLMLGGMAD